MSRIHLLSGKLVHGSHQVRVRAATNLFFKIKSDLLSDDPECVLDILENINKALGQISSDTIETKEFASLLLNLAINLLPRFSGKTSLMEPIAVTVSHAFRLCNEDIISHETRDMLNDAVNHAQLSSNGERGGSNNGVDSILYSFEESCRVSESVNRIDGVAALSQWALHQHRVNAGSILFSELSYTGWHFPDFVWADCDERYLFDVEVLYLFNTNTSIT